MPEFKDYAENGELLQTRHEPINLQNFERYISENSLDKAMGYVEALQDITKQIEEIPFNFFPHAKHGEIKVPEHSSVVNYKLKAYINEKLCLLTQLSNYVEQKLQKQNKPN